MGRLGIRQFPTAWAAVVLIQPCSGCHPPYLSQVPWYPVLQPVPDKWLFIVKLTLSWRKMRIPVHGLTVRIRQCTEERSILRWPWMATWHTIHIRSFPWMPGNLPSKAVTSPSLYMLTREDVRRQVHGFKNVQS